jgi:Predicted dehydrogenases and related proteins
MDKVKIAFIGCGGIAGWHLSHLVNQDDVEYLGFCDIIPERAESFKQRTGGTAKTYTDYKVMLDEITPDAVYICVPPHCHGEIEFTVIDKGIPFLVEKPMALDYSLAVKICEAAEKKGLTTAVGFQDRYLGIIDKTKEYIKGKKIGLVTGAWVGGIPGVWWWRKMETSGGQIAEQNIHIFDMSRNLFGEPAKIYASAGKGIVDPEAAGVPGYDVDDYSSAVITFKNGIIVTLFTGDYIVAGGGMQCGLNIYCADATVEYGLRSFVKYRDASKEEITNNEFDSGITEDKVFINAIKTGDPSGIRSPYRDALSSLKLVLAANESIATGKEIAL